MKKTWLIFGGSGFIGVNLILNIIKKNKVICVDNSKKNNKIILNLLEKQYKKNFTLINASISDFSAMKKIFHKYEFDIILNLAAITSVHETSRNPKKTIKVNVDGFKNIFTLMKQFKKNNLIFASSCAVYGDTLTKNNENSKLKPKSLYGLSKARNEKIANQFFIKYKISSIGLRFSNVYGKFQSFNSLYSAVILKWINLIRANKSIIIHNNRKICRDFIHINDVIKTINLSSNYLLENKKVFEIFNIASGKSISLNKLLNSILDFLKIEKKNFIHKIKYKKTPKDNIIVSKVSINKIKNKLFFKPNIDIKRGLRLSYLKG